MSVNSYLTNLANGAIVRDVERDSIQRSIDTLRARLTAHFPGEITDQFVFGSYSRGTILPRSMDAQSDVDYMVVFKDGSLRPQAYLDRLRRFSEQRYTRSEIAQANPTIALELDHIRFELVPAIRDWFYGTRIPAKASSYQDWLNTDPKVFNERLSTSNQANGNLIKPLVRLIKYWNAKAGYPFESYDLEQKVVAKNFGFFGLFTATRLSDLFNEMVQEIDAGLFAPQSKQEAVTRLKQLTSQANSLERSGQEVAAEKAIMKLLPPVDGLFAR